MIEFERVSRRFGDQDALRNLNLTLESGEMAFLTGHSGAGKSTLLRLLLLLDRPSSGEIRVNGEPTSSIRSRKVPRYRRRFGVVFQDHRLLFDRSVHDNVALPLVMAGFSPRTLRAGCALPSTRLVCCLMSGQTLRCCQGVSSNASASRGRLSQGRSS